MKPSRLIALLFSVACLFAAPVAVADPAQLSAKERSEAAAQVKIADQLINFGKYDEALSIYSEVYGRTEDQALFFGMAQCYRYLGKNKEAAEHYKKFLASANQNDPSIPEAQKQLARMETKIAGGDATTTKVPRMSPVLYGASAVTGVIGLRFGVRAVSNARVANDLQDLGGDAFLISFSQNIANRSATRADLCFVFAAGLGVGGYFLAKKEREQEASLSISPNRVALTVSF
jgi:tetratricopeptide (TPR) repeat protein